MVVPWCLLVVQNNVRALKSWLLNSALKVQGTSRNSLPHFIQVSSSYSTVAHSINPHFIMSQQVAGSGANRQRQGEENGGGMAVNISHSPTTTFCLRVLHRAPSGRSYKAFSSSTS